MGHGNEEFLVLLKDMKGTVCFAIISDLFCPLVGSYQIFRHNSHSRKPKAERIMIYIELPFQQVHGGNNNILVFTF